MHDFTNFPSDKFYDIWTQQRRSVSPCKLLEQIFENFTTRGRFSKRQKLLTKFSGLATSGCHINYTMITHRRKISTKWSLYQKLLKRSRYRLRWGLGWARKAAITYSGPLRAVGRLKSAMFDQYFAISEKRCKIWT